MRSKLFRNEEEQADGIPKPFRSKEEQTTYSKIIQERRGTNQISPILFRTKGEQTKLFLNFSRSKWNKPK